MSNIKLATGPVSWGVDFAESPGNPPWNQVLDDIANSAVEALELGPIGYLPEDSAWLRDELQTRALTPVGSFIFDDLHDATRSKELLMLAERTARWISGSGGKVLVIIDRPGRARVATAGRSDAAPRLNRTKWHAMIDTISRIAAIARDHDLTPTVHPHAGGYIEFQDEIERLLADSDLPLCLDTGHAAYAGITPEAAIASYGDRIRHLHLKDINGTVLARVHDEALDFWAAIAAGVFCPLGDGVVDLPAVAAALSRIDYQGFATIEQDRVPGSGTPLEDLERCLAALDAAGIGSTPIQQADNISTASPSSRSPASEGVQAR
jgi:inosose dehydratase